MEKKSGGPAMYNQTVMDHFTNPRNTGKIDHADGTGTVRNGADGDRIQITLQVRDGRIADIRFQTYGCAAAIAASSMVTELALGHTIRQARTIRNEDVNRALGGLPQQKLSCSNVAADALQLALDDYEARQGFRDPQRPDESSSWPIPADTQAPEETPVRLTPKQSIRYQRHIIIPDIGAKGQQALLDAHVLVVAPSTGFCDLTLLYLAAAGTGTLSVHLEDNSQLSKFLPLVRDLNPDIELTVLETLDWKDALSSNGADRLQPLDLIILSGPGSFLEQTGKNLPSGSGPRVLLGLENGWYGALRHCPDLDTVHRVLESDIRHFRSRSNQDQDPGYVALGTTFTAATLGLLSVNQALIRLIGQYPAPDSVLSFNLESLSFWYADQFHWEQKKSGQTPAPEDWKERLASARILLIGTGGLGSPAAYMLAKAGVGTLGLADYDLVEPSNLNRQILHAVSRTGMRKTDSAAALLKTLFPDTHLILFPEAFDRHNARQWLDSFQVVIDGLDNLPGRYLLNDACYFSRKPFITAGVLTYYGLTTTIIPDAGPCYRCLFPRQEGNRAVSCADGGVLGPVPGLLGLLEALQAAGLLLDRDPARETLLMFDARENEIATTSIHRSDHCPLCGPNPVLRDLEEDYSVRCSEDESL